MATSDDGGASRMEWRLRQIAERLREEGRSFWSRELETTADAIGGLRRACAEAVEEARERDEDMGMNCWPLLIKALARLERGS